MVQSLIAPFVLCLLLFSSPRHVYSQVTTDNSCPFNLGQTVLLPGTTVYLGDLPHEIEVDSEPEYTRSLLGWMAPSVGWIDPVAPSPAGLRTETPGLFFEGIPYPLASHLVWGWMPAVGKMETLNFPAQAWWGPTAASGAVQIELPNSDESNTNDLAAWGGSGEMGGAWGVHLDSSFSIEGNFRREVPGGLGTDDSYSAISRARWFSNDSARLETGFLGTGQTGSGNYWVSTFTNLELFSPNFQTFQLKPYFQATRVNGQSAQEIGSLANYHFNMAGLLEAHLGGGIGYVETTGVPGVGAYTRGFIQASGLGDILGMASLDGAIRLDESGLSPGAFSALVGLQGSQEPFTLLADFGTGVLADSVLETRQWDLGIRFQPGEEWTSSLKYVDEWIGTEGLDGLRFQFQWNHEEPFFLLRRLKFRVTEQILRNSKSQLFYDTGGRLEFGFFQGDRFWVEARGLSDETFFGMAGLDFWLSKNFKLLLSASNLGNAPLAWPDLDQPIGTTLTGGVDCEF